MPLQAIFHALPCFLVRPMLNSIPLIRANMKKVEIKKIPNNLRRYRKAVGLKQKDVAEILNLQSSGMISRWEKGVCLPSLLNAIKLSGSYCVLVDALFFPMIRLIKRKIMERQENLRGKHA